MIKNKLTIGVILLTMLVGMALIPAVSAQKEDNYSVTAEEAFKHANAHMISFIAADAPGFENWTGYIVQDGYTYLRLNDPEPVGSSYGNPGLLERTYGSSESTRIVQNLHVYM